MEALHVSWCWRELQCISPRFNSPFRLFLEPEMTAAPLFHCHFVQNGLLKLEPRQKQMTPGPASQHQLLRLRLVVMLNSSERQ